jgi:hypothetical protein
MTLASALNITQSSAGTLRISGSLNDSAARAITKTGNGIVEFDASPTLGNGTALAVNAGTLRFALTSASPTIGTAITATVNTSATLELAGSVSALSSGANRVNITNNSTVPGLLVSGTNQQVGNIDGPGTTQVNAGSDLTANHIIQGALVIGGTPKSFGLVTINASDVAGNPLGQLNGLALSGSPTPSSPFGLSGFGSAALGSAGDGGDPPASLLVDAAPGGHPLLIPEPSSVVLILFGLAGVIGQRITSRCHARRNGF